MEVYFDNAATTKVYEEVVETINDVLKEEFANPSSVHIKGVRAENIIKNAKENIANLLKIKTSEIIFTSCATESNNMAIFGTANLKKRAGRHIITTKIEHPSVLLPMKRLEEEGFEVTYLDVYKDGKISLVDLKNAIRKDTIFVSIMLVNNEIGSIQPIKEAVSIVKNENKDIYFHTDAVQGLGKIPFKIGDLGVDMLTTSAHKIGGIKGVGFLYIKNGVNISPLILGGSQQASKRAGTESPINAASLSKCMEVSLKDFDEKNKHLEKLRTYFIEELKKLDDVYINNDFVDVSKSIVSASFIGVRSEVMLHALSEKNIYVSAGSACSSNKKKESYVLNALGLSKNHIESAIRFSLTCENTFDEVNYVIDTLKELLPFLRQFVRK